jgi:4-amino-4-deoxy-L-arabinose transferase-like glycosyltransferase
MRLYLSLTSFCIAADGPDYVRMARDFAAGHTLSALNSHLSPLYPWLIALVFRIVPDWELAGGLVSTVFGTATVVLVYLLIREVFERRDLAVGAAALAAIHPAMAAYSASVRTEAGFICLTLAAVWLFVAGVKRERLTLVLLGGAVGGVAYLYRAEGIGLLVVVAAISLPGWIFWQRWTFAGAAARILVFAVPLIVIASPYLLYLHRATGHWIVSRQLAFVAAGSVMEVARNKNAWIALRRSGNTSMLAPLMLNPRLYLYKVGYDFVMSFYYFAQAIEPPAAILLVIGLWVRGRDVVSSVEESTLAAVVVFYLCGFSLFNTGPRFMVHLIPYTFGWVMVGLETASDWVARLRLGNRRAIPGYVLGVVLVLLLLPRTLWPLGYDLRGFRYAADDVRHLGLSTRAVAAPDGRFAFYVGAKFIALPRSPRLDMCGWLVKEQAVDLVMVSEKDERRRGLSRSTPCLRFIKRYPRMGKRYYDLFRVMR